MLATERRLKLVALIRDSGIATTEALASELNVSAETVRRDILFLAERGEIFRVHGGATTIDHSVVSSEPPFDVRREERLQRKKKIAKAAAALVPQGGTILLDLGTTALLTARALPYSLSATIVTTSLRVAVELADRPNLEVLVAGGTLRKGDLAVSGSWATKVLQGAHFDFALLGSGGLDVEWGLTDYYLEEANLRSLLIKNSTRSFILVDATKFNQVARYRVCGLDTFTGVVTDQMPEGLLRRALDEVGAELILGQ